MWIGRQSLTLLVLWRRYAECIFPQANRGVTLHNFTLKRILSGSAFLFMLKYARKKVWFSILLTQNDLWLNSIHWHLVGIIYICVTNQLTTDMKEIISNPWMMLVAGIIIGIIIHILYEKLVSRSANKELVKASVSAIIFYVAFCSAFLLLNYIAKCCSS